MQNQPHEFEYRFESKAFNVHFSFALKALKEKHISPFQMAALLSDEPTNDPPTTKQGVGASNLEPLDANGSIGPKEEKETGSVRNLNKNSG